MMPDHERLLVKARECHELAETAMTPEGREILDEIAVRYEQKAALAAKRIGRPTYFFAA